MVYRDSLPDLFSEIFMRLMHSMHGQCLSCCEQLESRHCFNSQVLIVSRTHLMTCTSGPQTIVQFGYPFTPDYVGDIPIVTFLFALCPWALLSKGFNDLGLAASGTNPGLNWSERNRYKCCSDRHQRLTSCTPSLQLLWHPELAAAFHGDVAVTQTVHMRATCYLDSGTTSGTGHSGDILTSSWFCCVQLLQEPELCAAAGCPLHPGALHQLRLRAATRRHPVDPRRRGEHVTVCDALCHSI